MLLRYRIQGRAREALRRVKPLVRRIRRDATLLAYTVRRRAGWKKEPPRIVVEQRPVPRRNRLREPAITVVEAGASRAQIARLLEGQTEASLTLEAGGEFLFLATEDVGALPATHLESMLLAAASEDLELVGAGPAPPAGSGIDPTAIASQGAEMAWKLVRRPRPTVAGGRIVGRIVPHVGARAAAADRSAGTTSPGPPVAEQARPAADTLPRVGASLFSIDRRPRGIVRQPLYEIGEVLRELPAVPGPPTVLFLLPYLARGGAEHLLFDLLAGLQRRMRSLVVTFEPHRAELGQTVDRARELTPHVYTLGDWLQRQTHTGAIEHLLRRYEVGTVMCWNGCAWFYDQAVELARRHPSLRLVNQLYNHWGGWIDHYSEPLARSVDVHVAVTRGIVEALLERGVAEEHVQMIHHGVRVPPLVEEPVRRRLCQERRRELGLPLDALVVGTFVRMDEQKRPLDVVRLARRFRDRGVVFLLVGGGPLDRTLDREIASDPPPNLLRLPMRRDPHRLYDAVDVCLCTSSYEGLPVFLLDSLARGIPCISTPVGDVPELLADGGGMLVEGPGALDEMAAAIENLLPVERRRIEGERGRRTVTRRFGIEGYVAAYEKILLADRGVVVGTRGAQARC